MASDAMNKFKRAPSLRPAYNVGLLMDIPTGRFVKGLRGENILLSGAAQINSICGPGNSYKSELALEILSAILGRYRSSNGQLYDTENTMTYSRIARALHRFPNTADWDPAVDSLSEVPKCMFVQGADCTGDVYFDNIKEFGEERIKLKKLARKADMITMPIPDASGKAIKMLTPFVSLMDSLSMFTVSSVLASSVDKHSMGDAKNNTMFMRDGAAKTQMFVQLPNLTAGSDMVVIMVAHVGHFIEMSQYAPKPATLAFSKPGAKLKNVPEKFTFINNNVFEIFSAGKLINPTDKAPMYPRDESDKAAGNDLMQINAFNTRNKSGPTGVSFNWVVSQKEGIQRELTEFNYVKSFGSPGWGISGNDRSYAMDLRPEVSLSRTTVRSKLTDDPLLARAVNITTEMLQMQQLWSLPEKYRLSASELYSRIKAKGYDWDVLLNTRGYWVFMEDEKGELPHLSTMDLLQMANDEYHPFWMPKKK